MGEWEGPETGDGRHPGTWVAGSQIVWAETLEEMCVGFRRVPLSGNVSRRKDCDMYGWTMVLGCRDGARGYGLIEGIS